MCCSAAPRPLLRLTHLIGLSKVIVMMSTQTVTTDLDTVVAGSPNPTPVEMLPINGCTFVWEAEIDGIGYLVVCTREPGHVGKQHVAEGDEESGVVAVHPWVDEE